MPHKLLIVDDDKDLLSILEEIFKEENYLVATCADGLDAIEKCRSTPFDLIITDIMMPGATGLEVLREARKTHPETMVILITGFASLETAISAIREGAYDYITKPFKLEQIKIAVKNALEKIALIKENKRLIKELEQAYEELRLVKRIVGTNRFADQPLRSSRLRDGGERTFISDDLTPYLMVDRMKFAPDSFINDLERISLLRDKGLITTREFELCKAKLFKSLR